MTTDSASNGPTPRPVPADSRIENESDVEVASSAPDTADAPPAVGDVAAALGDVEAILLNAATSGAAGAVWKLQPAQRQLDANVVLLPAGDGIGWHSGPDLDVLVLVLSGSGELTTEAAPIRLRTGLLVWLPRRTGRAFAAGEEGLSYFTVHLRRVSGLALGGLAGGGSDAQTLRRDPGMPEVRPEMRR